MQKNVGSQPAALLDNRKLCMGVLLMALLYNVIFGCVRNPLGEDNTISWIGYDHPFGFLVWGGLTAAAFFLNIAYLYRRYHYRGKIGMVALYTAPMMAMTVIFINDWGWEHVLHWIGAIGFIALNGAALLLFFLHNFKKHISYRLTAFGVAGMLLAMLIILLTVGKSGLLELIPMWIAMALLFLVNFTNLYPVLEEEAPAPQKPKDRRRAEKLAWWLGMTGAHEFYQNRWPQAVGHLLMTYVGFLLCLDRFIGMGNINNIQGESAWIYLAVGLSVLLGSLAWAWCDAAELRHAEEKTAPQKKMAAAVK
ncbi:MAG TPA: hypothetical protein IAD07_02325 [Candidatus Fimivicinus intestinavium]|nr:hypothetical protein [Candidatus Fimivicinus intestinavium]